HQRLLAAGIAAAPVAGAAELLACAHLRERGFWRAGAAGGELPGFPWRGSVEPHSAPAPALGADNEWVAREILGLDEARYRALCEAGAFG
ncbi:MAG: CoA transferase, partial [Gammaproteobacteria bacterium]|nr:CoA transferase [Gammaproteobacteria bacterium]